MNLSAYGAVAGDADDVLQEVWLRALSEFPKFDAERATFRRHNDEVSTQLDVAEVERV